ncbi:MAG: YdcF family protein, partial [Rubrobacteraceae bacterium]
GEESGLRRSLPLELAGDFFLLLRVFSGGSFRRSEAPPPVAVVLGAQVLSGGRPSETLQARTLHAAKLFSWGRAQEIVVTGGVGEHPPSEAAVMSDILCGAGVPESAIVLEDRALSTWDSARRVSRMMREIGVEIVLVVTDPLHCVRTVAAFEEMGLGAVAEPVYGSPMWGKKWMRFGQLLREMGALVWYRTKHGVGSRSRRWPSASSPSGPPPSSSGSPKLRR